MSLSKTCIRCDLVLPVECFKGSKGREYSFCIDCKRSYDRTYWAKTKAIRVVNKKENSRAIRQRNSDYVMDVLFNSECADCKEDDYLVLEFDHRDPDEKEANIADLVGGCASLERLQKEIDKCDVVCANCHRRRTARQFGYRRVCFLDNSGV